MYILFPEKNVIKQWQLLELTFRAQKWPRLLTPWDAEVTGVKYFHSVHLIVYVFSTNTLNKGSPLLKNLVDLYNSPRLKKVKTLRVHVIAAISTDNRIIFK